MIKIEDVDVASVDKHLRDHFDFGVGHIEPDNEGGVMHLSLFRSEPYTPDDLERASEYLAEVFDCVDDPIALIVQVPGAPAYPHPVSYNNKVRVSRQYLIGNFIHFGPDKMPVLAPRMRNWFKRFVANQYVLFDLPNSETGPTLSSTEYFEIQFEDSFEATRFAMFYGA